MPNMNQGVDCQLSCLGYKCTLAARGGAHYIKRQIQERKRSFMATDQDIRKAETDLDEKWDNPPARDALFGNILKSIKVQNIRGLNINMEFTWPVTAIGGTNGAGKTTLIQIASCAYVQNVGGRYYKLGGWIRNALEGESPAVRPPAQVGFTFWDETAPLEIPYSVERTRWNYQRRGNPERHVEFVGIAAFAPRIERKDRTHVFRNKLQITDTDEFDPRIVESISKIVGRPYQGAKLHTVSIARGGWSETLPELTRSGANYSEPHMGAGEQKVVRLVHALETLPSKSLILLEEPEITLHPDAQRGLAWYLMTLSRRKGHQIIIATHSPEIFEALPSRGRVLLVRDSEGNPEVLHNVRHLSAARELSGQVRTNNDLILVEDLVAKTMLLEVFRRHGKDLLDNAVVIPIGNIDDVHRTVRLFRSQGVQAVGVRDPDVGESRADGMFSLPGDKGPEQTLLEEDNVERARKFVDGLREAFERAEAHGLGFEGSKKAKKIFEVLPHEAGLEEAFLADRLTLAWLDRNNDAAIQLVEDIREKLPLNN